MKKIRKYCVIVLIVGVFLYIKDTKSKYVLDYKYNLDTNISIDKISPKICVIDKNLDVINNIAIEEASVEYSDELSGIKSATWKYNSASNNFDNITSNQLNSNIIFRDKGWYKIEVEDNAENRSEKIFYLDSAICRIEEKYYRKLENAINEVIKNNKTTIVMLKDIKEDSYIHENKNIVIDLSNKTIEGSFKIENQAHLEIKNGTVESDKIVFNNYGELKIIDGNYISSSADVIQVNDGQVEIDGGEINGKSGNVISLNNGEVNIQNGVLKSTGNGEIIHVKNGKLILKNGTLINEGENAGVLIEKGTVNLYGGKIIHTEASYSDVIALQSEAVLNIDGAVIENNTNDKGGWACISSAGTVNVISGEIKNTSFGRAIYSYGGSLKILGGIISNVETYNTPCVDGLDIFNMTGGIIQSKCNVCTLITGGNAHIEKGIIKNEGSGDALRINSGSCNISGGNFEAKEGYAIYKISGECKVSNATIIGKTLY